VASSETSTPNAFERWRWNDAYWTSTWPTREALTGSATMSLLERLALRDGERVLDVGSGAGTTTIEAARSVAPSGEVVGADISAPLVALAQRSALRAGAENVRFVLADVQTERVDGGPFDVVMSQFGVMFFEDPVAAFASLRAQVADGGRLGFACWQAAEKNPWFLGHALAGLVPGRETAPGAHVTGPFALSDPDEVAALLGATGWGPASIEAVEATATVPREAIADEGQPAFLGVPTDRLGEARDAVERLLEGFEVVDGNYRVPIAYFVVSAAAAP